MSSFSSRERRGIISLIILCVIILCVVIIYPRVAPAPDARPLYRELPHTLRQDSAQTSQQAADSEASHQAADSEASHQASGKSSDADRTDTTRSHKKHHRKKSHSKSKHTSKKAPQPEPVNPLDRGL
jgi:cytoskeletal protein RodZ